MQIVNGQSTVTKQKDPFPFTISLFYYNSIEYMHIMLLLFLKSAKKRICSSWINTIHRTWM